LHVDGFFRCLNERPDYIILFCVNPWDWGESLISDIQKSLMNIKKYLWSTVYRDILNTKVMAYEKWISIWDVSVEIFQKYDWKIFEWKFAENIAWVSYFCVSDNMHDDRNLWFLQKELDKNVLNLWKLNKWEIIIINNRTFAHGRTEIVGLDRFLIRVQIKNT
jgi:hypothetical protein